ncbi:T9SS type A sorting domain-containing protein [Tenacibaculum sp. ZS6-P6]|uniref:T9SS type A sorting domain-containing protein n=1 Tax=Tenacibaculum sp. ZS6-P6 TaxID=3447503 RepID=UPI003F9C8BA9
MKRNLLLILLLFSILEIFSQEYKLTYRFRLEHTQLQDICTSRNNYELAAYLNSGQKVVLEKFGPKSYFSNIDVTKDITFQNNDKISYVRFTSYVNDENSWGGCHSGDYSDVRFDITNYPCFEGSRSGFMRKNLRTIHSYFKYTITPVTKLSYADSSSPNITKLVCENDKIAINSIPGFDNIHKNNIYRWEFEDNVNTVLTKTDEYEALQIAMETAFEVYAECETLNNDSGNPILPRTGSAPPNQKDAEKELVNRVPILGGGQPSPGCRRWYDRYIQALNAYNNYTGEKYYPRSIWRSLSSITGQSSVSLGLSDFYSSEVDQNKALNNKKIRVRMNPSCNGDNDISNILTLQFLPEPPKAAKPPTFDSPSCSYDEVKNFTLFFARKLFDSEEINISLKKKLQDNSIVTWNVNTNITTLNEESDGTYSYSWQRDTHPDRLGNLIVDGDYYIEVTGYRRNSFGNLVQNCEALKFPNNGNSFYEIRTPKPVLFLSVTLNQNETCPGKNDGQIKVKASGGSDTYKVYVDGTYKKTFSTSSVGGVAETIIENLSPGNKRVTILDSKNCQARNDSNIEIVKNVTINAATQIVQSAVPSSAVTHPSAVNNNDGTIYISSVTGGTRLSGNKYKYIIILNGNTSTVTTEKLGAASGFTITDLPAGTHIIKYTDANNCSKEFTLPTIIKPDPVDFSLTQIKADCFEGNGKLTISNISGGYEKYTVIIKRGTTTLKTINNVVRSSTITENLKKGTYTVIIKDSRNGERTKSITVQEASEIVIKDVVIVSPIKCYGENATLKVVAEGGKSGIIYEYGIYESGTIKWQDENSFSVKASSVGYKFKVRNKNIPSCTSQLFESKKIDQNPELYVDPNPSVTHNNVYNQNLGSISLNVSGGTNSYTITWIKDGVSISKEGATITGLYAGDYIATIKDRNNCTIVTKKIIVTQPQELKVSVTIQKPITCNGEKGILKANPTGGKGTYRFEWYKNNNLISGSNTITFEGKSGDYYVKVYDSYISKSSTSVNLGEPSLISFTLKKTDISCYNLNDGKIELLITGGKAPYEFSIGNTTNFQPVSSLNNNTIVNRSNGTFQIFIKDNLNCISAPKSVTINRPSQLVLGSPSIIHNDIINQSNGSISVNVTGGSGNYNYEWISNKDGAFTGANSAIISNLPAAIYTVKVKDKINNNCFVTANYEVKEPLPLSVTLTQTKFIQCNGEASAELFAKVEGGYPINSSPSDFEYKWYKLDGSTYTLLNSSNLKLDRLSGLEAGDYRIDIKDAKGITTFKTISINQPSEIKISLKEKIDVFCFNGSNGEIKIDVVGGMPFDTSGGTEPYSFKWIKKGDTNYTNTDQNINNLKAGEYFVEVTDKNICTKASSTFIITEPAKALKVTKAEIKDLTGFEKGDGSIVIEVDGGTTTNYKYEWRLKDQTNIISTEKNLENVQVGTYQLTLTNEKCTVLSELYTINQPQKLVIDEIVKTGEIKCNGDESVGLSAKVSGGVKFDVFEYVYSWKKEGESTELSNTFELLNRGAGNYVLTVKDKNENVAYKKVTIVEPPVLEITESNTTVSHVSCFGGEDGSIKVEATGGVGDYSYSWSNGLSGNELNGLKAGEYIVKVIDKNLVCEFEKKIVITEPLAALSIKDYTITDVSGFDLSNGGISIEVEGGTSPYTYEWTDASNATLSNPSANLTGVKAGVYTVKVTDAKGCEITPNPTYTIDQPEELEVRINKNDIPCFGQKGTAIANVTGGVKPYTYSWIEKGETLELSATSELLNISGGVYVIQVEDKNGNKVAQEVTIVEPPVLEIIESNTTVSHVSCFGGEDGSIKVEATGGVGDYSYSWSNGSSGNELNGLKAGEYIVKVIDKNLVCEFEKKIVITEPLAALSIKDYTITDVSGFDLSNGGISIEVEGGTSPYTYEWIDASNATLSNPSANLTGVKAGVYTVKVTDAKGCEITPNPTYTIDQPEELEVRINKNGIPCFGQKGTAIANVTGGVEPYTYSWIEKGETLELSATSELLNISGGVYIIQVEDKNGNKVAQEVTIVEPPVLEITESNTTVSHVSCFGGEDGSIKVEATGGVGDYSYSWSNGSSGNELNGLKAGEYIVKVIDKNLVCEFEKKIVITEPLAALSIKDYTITDVSGFDLSNGGISIEVEGGTSPYTYEWTDASNATLSNPSANLTGVKAGVYTVKVTDAKGCEITPNPTYTIDQPEELEVRINKNDIPCFGQNGTAIANVTGGVEPYTYSWIEKGETLELSATSELLNISGVEDKNGNKVAQEVTIVEPPILEITNVKTTDVTCYKGSDGAIEITVAGGVRPYSYKWAHSSIDSHILNDIQSDIYNVIITDANGCSVEREIIINQPEEYAIDKVKLARPTSDTVNNGDIEVIIVGGEAPYKYVWENESGSTILDESTNDKTSKIESLSEGIYTITITDAKNCVLSETYNLANPGELLVSIQQTQEIFCYGESNAILDVITIGGAGGNRFQWFDATTNSEIGSDKELKNIPAGNYYVIVSNAEGIEEKSSIFTVTQPEKVEVSISQVNASCFESSNASFKVDVTGGTGVYEYRYTNTSGYTTWTSITGNSITIENLVKGDYKVQVRDVNNCLATDAAGNSEYEINITQPTKLEFTNESIENVSGFGLSNGSIRVELTGGTPGYVYQWFDGNGVSIGGNTTVLENIPSGKYQLIVEDTKGCRLVRDYEVTQPDLLEVSLTQLSIISCKGSSNGSVEANVRGGIKDYTYRWYEESLSTIIGSTDQLSDLSPGNYYVEIEDANGNTVRSSAIKFTEPEILELTLASSYVSCGIGNDWTITSTVTGGTAPYRYIWNNGETTADLNNIVSGLYEVTVVDANGCSIKDDVRLVSPPEFNFTNESIENVSGFGLSNGSIRVELTGGTPGYVYQWFDGNGVSIGGNTTVLENIPSGKYQLIVEDTKGCRLVRDYEVTQPDLLEVSLTQLSIISCKGSSNGSVEANVRGGIKDYTYRWYEESSSTIIGSTDQLSDLSPGNYYVEIEDANGNTVRSSTIKFTEPEILELTLASSYVSCGIGNDWTIISTVTGGTAPYRYIWNNGETTADLNNIVSGLYEVTVVDANGCSIKDDVRLVSPPEFNFTNESIENVSGFGLSNGSIRVELTGGTPGYVYQWFDGNGVSIGGNTTVLENIPSGKYQLIVEDTKGCRLVRDYEVTQPDLLEVSLTQLSIISCKGSSNGSVEANVRGGIKDYTYKWYEESSSTVIGTANILSDLSPGNYYVEIEDANGNTVRSSTIKFTEPEILELTLASSYVSCGIGNDWTITSTVTGGTAPYRYIWNNGETTADLNNIVSGLYEVTVVDANGCSIKDDVSLVSPPEFNFTNESIENVSGFGLSNGSIRVELTGGTPGYVYQWFDGNGVSIGGNTTVLENIPSGKYQLIVEDTKGCRLVRDYEVTQPDLLEVSLTQLSIISCKGSSNGSVEANVRGGIKDYTYRWYEESSSTVIGTANILSDLSPGNYYVEIEDANGNTVRSSTIKFTEPEILELTLASSYVSCGIGNDWTITSTVKGGTAPYRYIWNNGETTADLNNIVSGLYEVTVVDINGCSVTKEIELLTPPELIISTEQINDPKCFNGSNGNIKIEVSGGLPPYIYEWNNGNSTNTNNNLTSGTYEVIITDSKGCKISKAYVLANPDEIEFSLGEDVTLCKDQTYVLNATIDNGVSYEWSSTNGLSSTERVIEVSEEGIYSVVITNEDGCIITDEIEIKRSKDDISSNFLVSSIAFVNEPIVAVNVSDPAPDDSEWILPLNVKLNEKTDEFVEFYFEEVGEYEITLYTKKGDCEAFQTKTVIITEKEIGDGTDSEGTNGQTPLITNFNIYPNPSSGVFALDLELKEQSDVSVKIYSLLSNDMIDYKKVENEKEYKIDYNLSMVPGLYFVLIETQNEKMVKKIIIR